MLLLFVIVPSQFNDLFILDIHSTVTVLVQCGSGYYRVSDHGDGGRVNQRNFSLRCNPQNGWEGGH